MAEILEYSLVVLVSTMFVAGSVLSFGAFGSFETGVSAKNEYSALSVLAQEAAGGGSSRAVLSLPRSVVSCQGGVMTVESGTYSQKGGIGSPCNFAVSVEAGSHVVVFAEGRAGLNLSVA